MTTPARHQDEGDYMAEQTIISDGWNSDAGTTAAGFYSSKGHGLLSDGARCMTALDMGGVIDIAGVAVRNPGDVRALGEHLLMLADRLASRS